MLNRAIRELVRTAAQMPPNSVRPANQTAPTEDPARTDDQQFATVLITGHEKLGWDSSALADVPNSNDVQETITGTRRIVASVQFFRGDAFERAALLQIMLSTQEMQYLMQRLGLGLEYVSSIMDLTGFVDTLPEPRARLELQFNIAPVATVLMRTYGTFPFSISTPVSTTNFEVTTP